MRFEDIPHIEETELQKYAVFATKRLGRQVLADAKLNKDVLLKDTTNELMLTLESQVFAHDDGTAEQEVYVDVEVEVSWRQILSFLFGNKRTVKDRVPVKVKARKWTMFPENNMVLPSSMGTPVVKIQTWVGDE